MTATLQIFINGDEIPPQPSPLHAEQTQVSHLFFAWAMLLAPHLLPSARLVLGDSHLEQGSPELDMVLQMWPHWGRVEGEITSLDLLFLIYPRILLQYKYL